MEDVENNRLFLRLQASPRVSQHLAELEASGVPQLPPLWLHFSDTLRSVLLWLWQVTQ